MKKTIEFRKRHINAMTEGGNYWISVRIQRKSEHI
jgi:hypothetical protein